MALNVATVQDPYELSAPAVGGWLGLMLFGLVIGALLCVIGLLSGLGMSGGWQGRGAFAFALFLVAAVQSTLAWMLLTRSERFPHLAIAWFAAGWPIIAAISSASDVPDGTFYLNGSIQWVLCAVVWIPYLLSSKRVAATYRADPKASTARQAATEPPTATQATSIPSQIDRPTLSVETSSIVLDSQDPQVDAIDAACEACWEKAYVEVNGVGRRNGLWAKYLTGAEGDESLATARYMGERSAALHLEHLELLETAKQAATAAEQERVALEALRAAGVRSAMPKGLCPSCNAEVVIGDQECWRCPASFNEWSNWKPIPINS